MAGTWLARGFRGLGVPGVGVGVWCARGVTWVFNFEKNKKNINIGVSESSTALGWENFWKKSFDVLFSRGSGE